MAILRWEGLVPRLTGGREAMAGRRHPNPTRPPVSTGASSELSARTKFSNLF